MESKGFLILYNWCPYKKENLNTDIHASRMLYKDEGRVGNDASASHGITKIALKLPLARLEA